MTAGTEAARWILDALAADDLRSRAGVHVGEIELRDLTAGSGLRFESRGAHSLKGVSEDWQLYALL